MQNIGKSIHALTNTGEMMNLVYLHGFKSNPMSLKAQQLGEYLAEHEPHIQFHCPDLNFSPQQVMDDLSKFIESLDRVALIGSSFGGFYATQMVARFGCPAVLINPAMRPWQLFAELYGQDQLPYTVAPTWTLTAVDLSVLSDLSFACFDRADKMLVLLQQGDEVLDYLEAQRYYNQQYPPAMVITEYGGNHAMDNFNEKIPMLLSFLKHSLY